MPGVTCAGEGERKIESGYSASPHPTSTPMSVAPVETAPAAPDSPRIRAWVSPRLSELPKLTKLTLASAIGGGGGTGGGGSTVFGLLLGLLTLAGCSATDRQAPELATPPALGAAITCHADVAKGTVACGGPSLDAPSYEIIGGQGNLIALRSSNVSYDGGTEIFSFDVTLQNLSAQYLGWDGAAAESIAVFFESGPTVTGGTGTITTLNASGPSTFTAAGQYYFLYDSLPPGNTSAPLPWQLSVPATVTSFDFTVQVAATVPDFGGVLRWVPIPEFTALGGGATLKDIAANSAGDALAVGTGGRTYQKVGNSWRLLPTQFNEDWYGVEAIGGGAYVGATIAGRVAVFKHNVWRTVHQLGISPSALYAESEQRILVGGVNRIIWWNENGDSADVPAGGGGFPFNQAVRNASLGQAVVGNRLGVTCKINLLATVITSCAFADSVTAAAGITGQNPLLGRYQSTGYMQDYVSNFLYVTNRVDSTIDAIAFGAGGVGALWFRATTSRTTGHSRLTSFGGGVWTDRAVLDTAVKVMVDDKNGGLYLLSDDGIRRWNGSGVVDELRMTDSLTAVAGGDNYAFVGTASGKVWRYDGTSWTDAGSAFANPVAFMQAWSTTSAVAIDTGSSPTCSTWDGTSWSTIPIPGPVHGYHSWDANYGVLVGGMPGMPTIWRGNVCFAPPVSMNPGGLTTALNAAWVSANNRFWVGGEGGKVLYWNGTSYVAHNTGVGADILAMHGNSDNDVWVSGVGYLGNWNGAGWSEWTGLGTDSIKAIWTPAQGRVYYGGNVGQMGMNNAYVGFQYGPIPYANGLVQVMSGTSANSVWALVGNGLYRGMR